MRVFLIHILFIFFCSWARAQSNPILTEVSASSIKLRWPGVHTKAIEGYNIYRKTETNATWIKLNNEPQYFVKDRKKLEKILAYKTDAFLLLFGIKNKEGLNQTAWDSTYKKPGAEAFIGAMSMVNFEYAIALGEMFTDEKREPNETYFYKITVINIDGIETDLAVSNAIKMSMKNSIPAVTEVAAIAKNKSVTVQWKVDKGLLQSGVYATFRVYSAIDLLGPFEQVNFYGFLSTTVNVKAGGETIDPNLLSYTVNYLENGKKYYFKIVPVNAFGTEGISSITVDAATADPANLSPPNNVSIKKSGALLKITFQEKGNYKIFRSQARKGPYILQYPPADILLETTDIWYDNNVQDGKDYWYIFYRTDGKNMGAAGDTLHYFNAETAAPMAPQNVKATASKGLISISWDPNKEEDLLGYEIERASDAKAYSRFLLTKNPIKNNFYKDTLQYLSRTIFHYLVYAIDQNYNRSRPSKIVAAQMPDFDPPAKPYITGLIEKDSNVKIEWEPPFDKDIAAYRIYKKLNTAVNWEKNGDTKFLFFYDKAIAGTWDYAVTAIDSNKNESPFSAVQTIWVHADKSLKTPVNGSIELKDGAVLLQWKPAPGSDPKGWQISRIANNQFIDLAELSATTLNYTDQFPVSGKLKYEIRATNAEYQMGVPLVLEIEFKP